MDTKKPAVPKFASFKPKAEFAKAPDPPLPPPTSSSTKDRDRLDRGHLRSSRHAKLRTHHRRHDQPRSHSPDAIRPPNQTARQEQPLYVVDKRGDPLIVKYGSNDRAKIPAYRRAGSGRVLGGQGRLRLLHDGPQELFSLGDRFGEGASAFRDRTLLSRASRTKTRVFRLRASQDQSQAQALPNGDDGFIPLSLHTGPAPPTKDDIVMTMDEQGPDYRSIMGKAKPRDFVDSDLESADSSDAEADDNNSSHPARKRSIELSHHVKEHPEDVGAWLELVDIQEDLIRLNEDFTRQEKTQDEAKALASLRVSLLEEALPLATSKSDKERVLLRLMQEGSRVWTGKALAKRWSDIKFTESSFALWKARLDHEKSNLATFTYAGIRQIHIERLQRLRELLSAAVRNALASNQGKTLQDICSQDDRVSDELIQICEELVYVFLMTTAFIRYAGYSELAVAAWQALLEIVFARPSEHNFDGIIASPAELISSFQDFWESEVPRIGEQGAQGWRHFTEAEEMPDLPEVKTDANPKVPQTRDVYKAWATREVQKSRAAALPARTLDEGTDDDPFRVVIFADLEPLLVSLPMALCKLSRVRAAIVDGFLLFCRLPSASDLDGMEGGYLHSMYRDSSFNHDSSRLDRADATRRSDTNDEGERQSPRFHDPTRRIVSSVDVMYAGSNWFRYFDHDASAAEAGLALAVTTQLATKFGHEAIAHYSLGLAYHGNTTIIRKTAKSLLKKWPGNTLLYTAYAVAEWRNGNHEVARTVLSSATRQDLAGKEQLWSAWAWLDIEAGDLHTALAHCIAAAVQDESSSAMNDADGETMAAVATYTQLLKARQVLSSRRDFLLSTGKVQQAAQLATLAVLLEYTAPFAGSTSSTPSRQGDIEAALSTSCTFATDALARGHASPSSAFASSGHLERHLQTTAHLLYLHTTRGAFRPLHLREQIQQTFLAHFPTNTIFLALFAWAAIDTTRILVTDPVRAVLSQQYHKQHDNSNNFTNRLFAIQHEMHIGTVHSVRQAFERALDASTFFFRNNNNIGLWVSYIRYCVKHKRELSQQSAANKAGANGKVAPAADLAKDIFYRALGACPWSKDVALEAFTTLVPEMESSELRAVWNTMVTKGLRVCVDLEEFGEAWKKRREHGP